MGTKSDFDPGMVVSGRQAGLSILETAISRECIQTGEEKENLFQLLVAALQFCDERESPG